MTRRDLVALVALAIAGLAAGLVAVALTVTSNHETNRVLSVMVGLLIGWSFIGAGIVARRRQRESAVGLLMAAVGLTWFLGALSQSNRSVVATLGVALGSVFLAVFVWLLVAYPDGRLRTALDRRVVASALALAVVGPTVVLLVERKPIGRDAPANAFLVWDRPGLAQVLSAALNALGAALVVAALVIVARRFRSASPPVRRSLRPMIWAGCASLVFIVAQLTLHGVSGIDSVVWIPSTVAFASVPFAFLGGLVERGMTGRAIGGLVVDLRQAAAPGELRDALRRALGDPSVRLAFWLPQQQAYVDLAGAPIPVEEHDGLAVTTVDREGHRIAALLHDPALRERPGLLEAAVAAAALALENERLQAELRARLDELRRSRSRLIDAADAERRRLERNLHDGAQQRLVSLALGLRLTEARLPPDADDARELLRESFAEVHETIEELRELARGIHPAVLMDEGLEAAVHAAARRASLPVEVSVRLDARPPPHAEVAAYYVVAEALANAAKYAQASQAQVLLGRRNGALLVRIADDGIGGADPARGTGLRGLRDRVEALDGSIAVHSEPGAGTVIEAEIPCAS